MNELRILNVSITDLKNSKVSVDTISAMNNSWQDNFLDVVNNLDELNQTILCSLSEITTLYQSYTATNNSWKSDLLHVNTGISGMSSSMVLNWPDAIACTVNGWGLAIFYLIHAPHTGNYLFYYRMPAETVACDFRFNTDGTYNTRTVAQSDCDGKSISQLMSAGQAFNFTVSV